jgi:amino acid transporter
MIEGVFTPSILTILGVIMYLRFGYVVGNVGLLGTLIIVTISTSITFLTALSIASIATDKRVKTGGAYYMISRALGVETGGAVGIPLYMAQALSVALYTIGFAESLTNVFPVLNQTAVGIIVTILVGVLALTSARIAVRSQYIVMLAIVISLVSLYFGDPMEGVEIDKWNNRIDDADGFWVVFAVFFPAVTGIMAGVNMSGDLKNPSVAIPVGTFLAVGVGYIIYMAIPIIIAGRVDAQLLVEDPLIMRKISFWGDSILLGVWGATLSSAIGSMLGAPRVLQALARDRVLPKYLRWLGRGSEIDDSPRIGTYFTLAIALIAVYFGDLNVIAPVLTMFFLATYGMLNISSALENAIGSPSFRPTFKVNWGFSLTGSLGCAAVMFLINPVATVIAITFLTAVFLWLEHREMKTTWGDVRQGIWLSLIRMGLINLSGKMDPKNWRPHILVLSGAPTKRWNLITLTNEIVQNRGLMTISTILSGDESTAERRLSMENKTAEYLKNRGINSLVKIITSSNIYDGARQLVNFYGIGHLVPNIILLGDSTVEAHYPDYCNMVSGFYREKRNILIVKENDKLGFGKKKKIDVWWRGLKRNGALMIIIAHLLRRSMEWRHATIRLNMVLDSENAAAEARKNISEILKSVRIDIQENLVVSYGQTFHELRQKISGKADLVMLGMAEPDERFLEYYTAMIRKIEGAPSTMFVLAGQEVNFEEVLL